MPDWYSVNTSSRWEKQIVQFKSNGNTIFVDATEFGDLLALSSAPYLQGIDERYDGDIRFKHLFLNINTKQRNWKRHLRSINHSRFCRIHKPNFNTRAPQSLPSPSSRILLSARIFFRPSICISQISSTLIRSKSARNHPTSI